MKLIIEPDDGVAAIVSQIRKAKESIEIAIFRLDHKDVEAALKTAAEKGVRVHALIASASRGGEQSLRKLELRLLEAGVIVARTAGDSVRYHNKYMVVDRSVLCVLSMNMTRLDIDHSRGFGIITTRAEWVNEARRLFKADTMRTKYATKVRGFVVSPANARKALGAFLRDARKQLLIYDPKIADKEMLRELQDRQKAGVEIRIIGSVDRRTGLDVQKLGGMRLHTRTIIRDGRDAFIGSQSLRTLELDSRRELGLIVREARTVKKLVETFEADWDAERSEKALKADEKSAGKPENDVDKAVVALEKDLTPVVTNVKKAVKRAVAAAGDDTMDEKQIANKVKKLVKKAVKAAVQDAVLETQEA